MQLPTALMGGMCGSAVKGRKFILFACSQHRDKRVCCLCVCVRVAYVCVCGLCVCVCLSFSSTPHDKDLILPPSSRNLALSIRLPVCVCVFVVCVQHNTTPATPTLKCPQPPTPLAHVLNSTKTPPDYHPPTAVHTSHPKPLFCETQTNTGAPPKPFCAMFLCNNIYRYTGSLRGSLIG